MKVLLTGEYPDKSGQVHTGVQAYAVVTKDLPDKAVAAGVPARIISYDGSGDFVAFRK